MGEAPLREDGPAARHDPGEAVGREGDVTQQHAGVNREVIHPLLALLDDGVSIQVPRQVLGLAADLLERLVNRHRADRHRRIADDPLARFVDLLAGGQVHHRVSAPERCPPKLLHFFLDGRGHGGVADVGVDLDEEVPADDHRLELGMVDIGRDDRPAARDLGPDELHGQALANRDELHLRRDLSPPCVVQLCHA